MGLQIREKISAVVVPRAGRGTRVAAGYDFERRVRRIAGEIFVRIDLVVAGMIDRKQTHLVEVDDLFHGLHQTETELAIFFANRTAINFDVFRGTRNVALPGADPVSDHAGSEHVGDEFVALAVPNKKGGTRTATAINLVVSLLAHAGDFDFILYNSRGPEHSDNIRFLGLSQPYVDQSRVLAE